MCPGEPRTARDYEPGNRELDAHATARCLRGQPGELLRLAEAYRAAALLLLYQTQSVSDPGLGAAQTSDVRAAVTTIMHLLETISPDDPLLSSVGPFLVIAGSELGEDEPEARATVRWVTMEVAKYIRVAVYTSAFELVQQVWVERALGHRIIWLELIL